LTKVILALRFCGRRARLLYADDDQGHNYGDDGHDNEYLK
jgi:hypothetical protein